MTDDQSRILWALAFSVLLLSFASFVGGRVGVLVVLGIALLYNVCVYAAWLDRGRQIRELGEALDRLRAERDADRVEWAKREAGRRRLLRTLS